jgi:hypothetical protein
MERVIFCCKFGEILAMTDIRVRRICEENVEASSGLRENAFEWDKRARCMAGPHLRIAVRMLIVAM